MILLCYTNNYFTPVAIRYEITYDEKPDESHFFFRDYEYLTDDQARAMLDDEFVTDDTKKAIREVLD